MKTRKTAVKPASYYTIVWKGGLLVRKEPRDNSEVLATLPCNSVVAELEDYNSEWFQHDTGWSRKALNTPAGESLQLVKLASREEYTKSTPNRKLGFLAKLKRRLSSSGPRKSSDDSFSSDYSTASDNSYESWQNDRGSPSFMVSQSRKSDLAEPRNSAPESAEPVRFHGNPLDVRDSPVRIYPAEASPKKASSSSSSSSSSFSSTSAKEAVAIAEPLSQPAAPSQEGDSDTDSDSSMETLLAVASTEHALEASQENVKTSLEAAEQLVDTALGLLAELRAAEGAAPSSQPEHTAHALEEPVAARVEEEQGIKQATRAGVEQEETIENEDAAVSSVTPDTASAPVQVEKTSSLEIHRKAMPNKTAVAKGKKRVVRKVRKVSKSAKAKEEKNVAVKEEQALAEESLLHEEAVNSELVEEIQATGEDLANAAGKEQGMEEVQVAEQGQEKELVAQQGELGKIPQDADSCATEPAQLFTKEVEKKDSQLEVAADMPEKCEAEEVLIKAEEVEKKEDTQLEAPADMPEKCDTDEVPAAPERCGTSGEAASTNVAVAKPARLGGMLTVALDCASTWWCDMNWRAESPRLRHGVAVCVASGLVCTIALLLRERLRTGRTQP